MAKLLWVAAEAIYGIYIFTGLYKEKAAFCARNTLSDASNEIKKK